MPRRKISFVASNAPLAVAAQETLGARYGNVPQDDADVVVALGGDGFMLQTLHATQSIAAPVYGMNRGTVGFLMNEFGEAVVRFDVLDAKKRPVMADADGKSVRNVVSVEIQSNPDIAHRILFDPGHGLDERLIREQFA